MATLNTSVLLSVVLQICVNVTVKRVCDTGCRYSYIYLLYCLAHSIKSIFMSFNSGRSNMLSPDNVFLAVKPVDMRLVYRHTHAVYTG